MNDPQRRRVRPGRPYTGDTIALPKHERERAPQTPDQPPPLRPRRARRQPTNVRRRRSIWERVRIALLIVLAVALVGLGVLYWQVRSVAQAIVVAESRANPPLASPLMGGANVLLIGVDERPDHPEEGVRSDTLILARLDALGRLVSMLSIPRDTQIDLPGVGATKINVAYGQGYARAVELYGEGTTPQQGGMALAAETVERFLGLQERGLGSMRVDYVAQVNFNGFAGLIDALGGVTIDVPKLIVDDAYPTENFGVMRVEFQPGVQRMDGETALIYARTRHADSDFGRAERQQQVLRAIVAELRAKGWIGRTAALPGLLDSVRGQDGATPPVITTLPIARFDVLLAGMLLAGGVAPDDIAQLRITPETVAVTENGSNLIWDPDGIRAIVDQFVSPPDEAAEEATVQVLNGTSVPGLAGQIALDLEQAGFAILVPDNAPPGDYSQTIVYNRNDKPQTARRVAEHLNAPLHEGSPPADVASEADIVVIIGADQAQP